MQQHRYGVNVEPLPGQPSGARTLSVSVDCDAIVDYLNFAPAGHRLGDDRVTYPVMMTRLLDLFAKHDIRATFYCIGKPLREDAEAAAIMRTAVSAGHRMGNHTYNHHEMSSLSDEAQRSEIVEGHRTVEDVLGVTPIGYRGPAYFVSTPILEELAGLGYLYDTSANSAPLVDFALSALSMLRTFRRKPRAPLQNLFTTDKASVIRIGSTRMMEWPIPVALGLPFYGTFIPWSRAPYSARNWRCSTGNGTSTTSYIRSSLPILPLPRPIRGCRRRVPRAGATCGAGWTNDWARSGAAANA